MTYVDETVKSSLARAYAQQREHVARLQAERDALSDELNSVRLQLSDLRDGISELVGSSLDDGVVRRAVRMLLEETA